MGGPFTQARGAMSNGGGEAPSGTILVSEHGPRGASRQGGKKVLDTSWRSEQVIAPQLDISIQAQFLIIDF